MASFPTSALASLCASVSKTPHGVNTPKVTWLPVPEDRMAYILLKYVACCQHLQQRLVRVTSHAFE